MSITVRDIAEALVNNKHGWSVAEQFSDTFEGGESFEQQNYSAMELVSSTLRALLRSEVLAEGYELDELKRYLTRLDSHLDTV